MKKIKYILILLGLVMIVPCKAQEQLTEDTPVILYSGTPKQYEIADIVVTGVENMDPSTLIGLSGLLRYTPGCRCVAECPAGF